MSLNDEKRAEALNEQIKQLKVKSEQYNSTHNITGVQKTRKNVRENFTYSLVREKKRELIILM